MKGTLSDKATDIPTVDEAWIINKFVHIANNGSEAGKIRALENLAKIKGMLTGDININNFVREFYGKITDNVYEQKRLVQPEPTITIPLEPSEQTTGTSIGSDQLAEISTGH